jgi:hypothetical protein
MRRKAKAMSEIQSIPSDGFYDRIRDILEAAHTGVVRTVNTAQVLSNWLIGREIVEAEQQGQHRADYGENLLKNLAQKLKQDFGKGYSYSNLKYMRQFYLAYSNLKYMRQFYLAFPHLLTAAEIGHAVSDQSSTAELSRHNSGIDRIHPPYGIGMFFTQVKRKVEPLPNSDSTQILPPLRSTAFLTIAKPIP